MFTRSSSSFSHFCWAHKYTYTQYSQTPVIFSVYPRFHGRNFPQGLGAFQEGVFPPLGPGTETLGRGAHRHVLAFCFSLDFFRKGLLQASLSEVHCASTLQHELTEESNDRGAIKLFLYYPPVMCVFVCVCRITHVCQSV